MDGHVTHDALLTFALGLSLEGERADIDAHLCSCAACVRAFLQLKRQVEEGEGPAPKPSAEVRARLRASVAAAFRPSRAARVAKALRRPIPLYQGAIAAALAVAIAALIPIASSRARSSTGHPGARVDTARLSPETVTIY